MSRVDLGFLEKTEPWLLNSNYFPSKVGGKPAWLALTDLPSAEEVQCQVCSKQMIFLCQVYAPYEEKDSCFHRTLFLFVCRNASCCLRNDNKNLVVWRCQLPRHNLFYSPEPPVEDQSVSFDIETYVKICSLCGSSATKHCSKCKVASYCSREHQITDWKLQHKMACGTESAAPSNTNENNPIIFDEWELIMDEEDDSKQADKEETAEDAEERRMREYQKLLDEGKAGTMSEISEVELQSHTCVDEDKAFLRFRKVTSVSPDQVLRYQRGGQPLWVASEPQLQNIPPCHLCDSPRQFEFQILPQLLFSLHENNLDWGTLVVYTCKANCDAGSPYKKEFVYKQDVSLSS